MKKLTTGKIWQFAAGQFGWAMLSGIISNWLVYFYQSGTDSVHSTGAGGLWHIYYYWRNYSFRKDF